MVSRYGQPANALTARPGAPQTDDPRRAALAAFKGLTAPGPAISGPPPRVPTAPNPSQLGGSTPPGTGLKVGQPPEKGTVAPPKSARDRAVEQMKANARTSVSTGQVPDPFSYDDLADQREQLERQRGVEERKLQAERAAALQEARARSNLAGGGLSGLSAANESRIASDQNAGRIDALSAFDERGREALRNTAADERARLADEQDKLRYDAERWDYESQFGVDIDSDGFVGPPGGPNAQTPDQAAALDAFEKTLANNQGVDLDTSWFDSQNADAPPGSEAVPFSLTAGQLAQAQAAGHNLQKVKNVTTGNALGMKTYTLYRDEEGRFYAVPQR